MLTSTVWLPQRQPHFHRCPLLSQSVSVALMSQS
jgi:hypothetical protein